MAFGSYFPPVKGVIKNVDFFQMNKVEWKLKIPLQVCVLKNTLLLQRFLSPLLPLPKPKKRTCLPKIPEFNMGWQLRTLCQEVRIPGQVGSPWPWGWPLSRRIGTLTTNQNKTQTAKSQTPLGHGSQPCDPSFWDHKHVACLPSPLEGELCGQRPHVAQWLIHPDWLKETPKGMFSRWQEIPQI